MESQNPKLRRSELRPCVKPGLTTISTTKSAGTRSRNCRVLPALGKLKLTKQDCFREDGVCFAREVGTSRSTGITLVCGDRVRMAQPWIEEVEGLPRAVVDWVVRVAAKLPSQASCARLFKDAGCPYIRVAPGQRPQPRLRRTPGHNAIEKGNSGGIRRNTGLYERRKEYGAGREGKEDLRTERGERPLKPLYRCDRQCSEKNLSNRQLASVVVNGGDEAYTTNLCQKCFYKHLQAKGEESLTSVKWRQVVEKKACRGRMWKMWKMIGKEPYLRGMWKHFSSERSKTKKFRQLAAEEKQAGIQGQWQQESPARGFWEQVNCCHDTDCNESMMKKGFTALKNGTWEEYKGPPRKR